MPFSRRATPSGIPEPRGSPAGAPSPGATDARARNYFVSASLSSAGRSATSSGSADVVFARRHPPRPQAQPWLQQVGMPGPIQLPQQSHGSQHRGGSLYHSFQYRSPQPAQSARDPKMGHSGGLHVRQPPHRSRPHLQPAPGPHVSQQASYFVKASDEPFRPQPHPLPQLGPHDLTVHEQPTAATHKAPSAAHRVRWLTIA